MPIQPSQPIKCCRLQAPIDLNLKQFRDENSLEVVMKGLQQDLSKQTQILTAILEALREQKS